MICVVFREKYKMVIVLCFCVYSLHQMIKGYVVGSCILPFGLRFLYQRPREWLRMCKVLLKRQLLLWEEQPWSQTNHFERVGGRDVDTSEV